LKETKGNKERKKNESDENTVVTDDEICDKARETKTDEYILSTYETPVSIDNLVRKRHESVSSNSLSIFDE